jgi:phosphate transport system substrate-binding protein
MIKRLSIHMVWIAILLVSCGRRDVESIVIRGSDTEVNLVLRMAETYMDDDPDISIAVTGGGSGTGIASLINKRTDIANTSRAFTEEELRLASERGVDVRPIVFAVDALCFIANENLPVEGLTLQQVREVYTGKTANWKDLGGNDAAISLYGRQGNSGTFLYIQKNILKDDYSLKMKQMNGNSQIIEGVRNDQAGIGYVGIGYVVNEKGELMKGIKVLSIQAAGQDAAVSPVYRENISNGSYKVVRPLYQYIDGKPEGKLLDFLQYELGSEGEKMILENGYFPISNEVKKQNSIQLSNE